MTTTADRRPARPLLTIFATAVALGAVIALLKADVSGPRATVGNLVGPWLITPFLCASCRWSRLRTAIVTWSSTAASLTTFYLIQGVTWGLVTAHSLPYDAFWVVAGGTSCVALSLIARALLRTWRAFVAGWGATAAVFALLHGGYWLWLGVSPREHQVVVCAAAAVVFVLMAVLSLTIPSRHATVSRPLSDIEGVPGEPR